MKTFPCYQILADIVETYDGGNGQYLTRLDTELLTGESLDDLYAAMGRLIGRFGR